MKKINIILVFLLLLATGVQAQKAVVIGRYNKQSDKEKQSVYVMQIGVWRGILAKCELTADKTFRLEVEVPTPGIYQMNMVDESFYVYLTPSEELHYQVDAGDVKITGKGNVAENQLLVEVQKCEENYYKLSVPVRTSFCEERAEGAWEVYNAKMEMLKKAEVSDVFAEMYRGFATVEYWRMMIGGISRLGDKALDPAYCKDLERVPLSGNMQSHGEWGNILEDWLDYNLQKGNVKLSYYEHWLADMASFIEDKELREAYIVRQIGLEVLRNEFVGLAENVKNVKHMIQNPENKAKIAEELNKMEKGYVRYAACSPGADLGGFEFKDRNGKMVKLGDLKGKYVYIDIWSTGCLPCKQEIPHLARLEKSMENDNIVFVSISLDKKEEVWQKFIKEKSLGGLQLITTEGFKNPICKTLGMSGIPQFVLLDPESRIINFNAKRPSNPVLWKYLQDVVRK